VELFWKTFGIMRAFITAAQSAAGKSNAHIKLFIVLCLKGGGCRGAFCWLNLFYILFFRVAPKNYYLFLVKCTHYEASLFF